ncbi:MULTISPECIES: hypothetical protein [Mycobacterium]|uniref:Uncharacterized protein n=1 Tax=Mycobacterium kiyosense TaxID=2871094 RepID=A0A9P3Q3U1_9MYCO|nr:MULTISPECIES: hypothetical protein [Mycobacterium]BDB40797.1 hypothetical protein IWGMT90018_12430 [Mycobacterium kiyosense]BDE12599.1 hypothetical protein MKCMC460_14590 [Mycobacterium sp. 20KCMC460]GLB84899.1 hypothetical protein SRL2020028_41550 [Mycobacterium kiyosense]GLB87954.1 hypothetical protein SRL2020130_07710 [Mycobacterium kiyosense]GLB98074.1 hypothetical protein SRL2020226_48500 [Mycobacterium kiyosense]
MAQPTSSYWTYTAIPMVNDLEEQAHEEVLVADARLDQPGICAAVEAVFEANPTLGAVFEPSHDHWLSRPGGAWSWAVEPPGTTVTEVIARQRAGYDKRTGRLFAVSLLPGARDRLVLTASRLCVDDIVWRAVVDGLMTAYRGGALAPDATYRARNRGGCSWAWWRAGRRRRSPVAPAVSAH